jgi:hypothetical protein
MNNILYKRAPPERVPRNKGGDAPLPGTFSGTIFADDGHIAGQHYPRPAPAAVPTITPKPSETVKNSLLEFTKMAQDLRVQIISEASAADLLAALAMMEDFAAKNLKNSEIVLQHSSASTHPSSTRVVGYNAMTGHWQY